MIIAITPTGGRPYQFALSEKYMARQIVKPDLWIVVDDCTPPTVCTMGQIILRQTPQWTPTSGNTQHRNWEIALDADSKPDDMFICWEDDDWYAPDYIARQVERMKFADLVGESPARYWNTKHRAYRTFDDAPNPSLAATAFRACVLPTLRKVLEAREWIDSTLWSRWRGSKLIQPSQMVLGIKGMLGRPGVSPAHRNEPGPGWCGDYGGSMLRQWIGREDAEAYMHVPQPEEIEQQPDLECGLKWFRGIAGQIRYRCPSCALDHYDPNEIGLHWVKEHQEVEDPTGINSSTLFGPDDKPLNRKIHVP